MELGRCLPTWRKGWRALASGRSSVDVMASIAHLSGAASMMQRSQPSVEEEVAFTKTRDLA
jgi:hypothetical protein